MKKQITRLMSTSLYSKSVKFFMVLFVTAASFSASAQDQVTTETPAIVRHVGNNAETMVFEVQFDNTTGDKYSIAVKDDNGSVLFQDVYSDKKFDRKFRLPKTNDRRLSFVIKNLKENNTQTFEINTNTRVIEEVVVTKVK